MLFKKRARAFLVDNERGKKITIRLGEGEGARTFALPESDERGHFMDEMSLSAEEARKLLAMQKAQRGQLKYRAVTRQGDDRILRFTP